MKYQIAHTTSYRYNYEVSIKPHILRLRPRCDSWQKLHSFTLNIAPEPRGISEFVDLEGNSSIKVWFDKTSKVFEIETLSIVETFKTNPFDYLTEPWALQLPIDYPHSIALQLQPYLQGYGMAIDPHAIQLAQELYPEAKGNTLSFLNLLNQRIYTSCEYIIRETGEPWFPGITWSKKQGSCRDLTILFIEVCRAIGLAARFVSGYQEGDSEQEQRDLHAWAEVYLPGAGWRGYDPTHGLAVSDRHIFLCASAFPLHSSPVSGLVVPVRLQDNLHLQSELKTDLQLILIS
jgi:transglutaminase-like putative cysteine protease